jgi:D-tyrosyl-tRNA(Tyr) deacylase
VHGNRVKGLVQRVSRAAVHVGEECTGAIGPGLFALIGVGHDDNERDASLLAERMVGLRVFADPEGKMNLALRDVEGALLVVSQFTLMGDTRRGRRPSFVAAAPPERARELIERLIDEVRGLGVTVATGRFGAHMDIEVIADGPVTLLLDTKERRSDA